MCCCGQVPSAGRVGEHLGVLVAVLGTRPTGGLCGVGAWQRATGGFTQQLGDRGSSQGEAWKQQSVE